jgi:protein-S-isoprenylcysteine O-methyltransferase Ste14
MGTRDAYLRVVIFILGLPLLIGVVLPIGLARFLEIQFRIGTTLTAVALQLLGMIAACVGMAMFISALAQIAARARTEAVWELPARLVIRGSYRWVRNPLVSGVLFLLGGEALVLQSWPHGAYALVFLVASVQYIALLEEPQLEARYGDEYRVYRQHVMRLMPRLRPWTPGKTA